MDDIDTQTQHLILHSKPHPPQEKKPTFVPDFPAGFTTPYRNRNLTIRNYRLTDSLRGIRRGFSSCLSYHKRAEALFPILFPLPNLGLVNGMLPAGFSPFQNL